MALYNTRLNASEYSVGQILDYYFKPCYVDLWEKATSVQINSFASKLSGEVMPIDPEDLPEDVIGPVCLTQAVIVDKDHFCHAMFCYNGVWYVDRFAFSHESLLNDGIPGTKKTVGGVSGVTAAKATGGVSGVTAAKTSGGVSGVTAAKATGSVSGVTSAKAIGGISGVTAARATDSISGNPEGITADDIREETSKKTGGVSGVTAAKSSV